VPQLWALQLGEELQRDEKADPEGRGREIDLDLSGHGAAWEESTTRKVQKIALNTRNEAAAGEIIPFA